MAGGTCIHRILVASVGALLVCACGTAGPNPSLVVAGFETVSCVEGSAAEQCVRLTAEVDGSQEGVGSCEIVATAADGSTLSVAERIGPLLLEPGRTYEWFVSLPPADNPAFETWVPVCRPRTSASP